MQVGLVDLRQLRARRAPRARRAQSPSGASSPSGDIATYVDDGHLRVTMERWVAFGDSNIASAVAAVTGRTVDRTGLMDLLERTAASMDPAA